MKMKVYNNVHSDNEPQLIQITSAAVFIASNIHPYEEIIDEKNCSTITNTPLLTTEDLCKRWNINADTLHNWEKKGKIRKLPLGGRKKMYSLKDVLEAEASGLVIAKAG